MININQRATCIAICKALDIDPARVSTLSINLSSKGVAIDVRYIPPDDAQTKALCAALGSRE